MSQRCIIHRVLAGECDANEVPIEALHASLSRMMTTFVLHPSAPLADTIGQIVGVLAGHDGRFGAVEGVDVYARMAVVWQASQSTSFRRPSDKQSADAPCIERRSVAVTALD